MKVKVAVVIAVLGLLLALAAPAFAGYQLRFGYAKRAISGATSSVCAQTNGCKSWSVNPCVRRSLHRIDCRSNLFFAGGQGCSFVTTASLPPTAPNVILHHKRIRC